MRFGQKKRDFLHPSVVQMSQRLDDYIIRYQKMLMIKNNSLP
ncbi:aspartyl-phosphate phosphatase Spo0E family protein [Brevibacillus centrosporus]